MMTDFTPVSALAGGALIGLSTVLLMASLGRVAGISGIVGGLLPRPGGDAAWRLAFLVGLVCGPFLYAAVAGPPAITIVAPLPLMAAGGLLVGIGTQLGSGCTSGHGVCGMARLSQRSILATLTFMATGIATVFVVRHVFGA